MRPQADGRTSEADDDIKLRDDSGKRQFNQRSIERNGTRTNEKSAGAALL